MEAFEKNCLDQLANCLQVAGNSLQGDQRNAAPLRTIQRLLNSCNVHDTEEQYDLFLLYFLETFIDKFFYNISGDVPYVEGITPRIQSHCYQQIGEILCDLAEHARKQELDKAYSCYVRLGTAYMEAVRLLNRDLAEADHG